MPYETVNGTCYTGDVQVIDLRSDTISKPTPEMREAMSNAEVGDDVYGEDPTVIQLEKRSAQLLDKEASIFLPTGTMGNLIAIMVHCQKRGSEIICGDNSHVFRFEQGGAAQIAGVQIVLVQNKEDGMFDLGEFRSKIRVNPDCHEPITELVVIENTHNMCGGKVIPMDFVREVKNIARSHNMSVHMDGARLMNAAVYLDVPVNFLVRDVDSVCYCLSKSLGCPVGSILAGSKKFIEQARRVRKVLGGGWRQAGVLAAAGLVALDKMIHRLQDDHRHIYEIAEAISKFNSKYFKVDLNSVQTNILIMHLDRSMVESREIQDRLATVLKTDSVKVSLKTSSRDSRALRFVTYWEITGDDVRLAIQKIILVLGEFEAKLKGF